MSPDPETTIDLCADPSGPEFALFAGGANPAAKVSYRFGGEIARGGIGSIIEAHDCKFGHTVVVKIMFSEMGTDANHKQLFINEAAVFGTPPPLDPGRRGQSVIRVCGVSSDARK